MQNFERVSPKADKEIATLFSSFPLLICAATELILSSENPNILVVKSLSIGNELP